MIRSQVSYEDASRFLEDHYGGRIGALEQLHGGEWSSAFGFDHDGEELVVRFGRYGEDYEADRQAFVYNSEELPVPPVLEIGQAFDGVYAVSERRRGTPLEMLSAPAWRVALAPLWQALDRLRSIEAPRWAADWREGLLELLEDKPGARVSGWSDRLAASGRISEVFRTGQRLLEELLPQCPPERYIVHNDLLHGNVLVDSGGRRIVAVFDWGTSLHVDFLYEIAHLAFFAKWYPTMADIDFTAEALAHYDEIGLEVPDFERRLCTYAIHVGAVHLAYGIFAMRPMAETEWIATRTEDFIRLV